MLLEPLAKLFRLDAQPQLEIINGRTIRRPAPRLLVFLAKLFRVDSNPKLAIPEDGRPTWEQVTGPRI